MTTIKLTGPRDLDALAGLLARNDRPDVTRWFHPFPLDAASARSIAEHAGRDRYYLAESAEGRILGLSMLRGWDEGYEIPSHGMLVDAEHRGNGLGARLVEHAVEQARTLGSRVVRAKVAADNEPSLRAYRAAGFVETAREPRGAQPPYLILHRELGDVPIPVGSPSLVGRELEYVTECLASGWISSGGRFVGRFERAFAAYCGAGHGVATSSGTTALHVGLLALGLRPGDEVVVPSLTYVATANAVRYCGARPILVDVDPHTWTLDPAAVEAAVTPRTRGIIAVHLYGHPADMAPLRDIADGHGMFVLEDAAQAHGAAYRGRSAGELGDAAAFSFFANKILSTGEGGMLVTDRLQVADRARRLAGQGQDPERRYWFPEIGFNYRMTNVAAAIGLAQVERADWHLERRREVGGWYRESLADHPDLRPSGEADWAQSSRWMTSVVLGDRVSASRDEVIADLGRRGIETRPVFPPMHMLPMYAETGGRSFPVADRLGRRGLTLPSSAALSRSQVDRVCEALADAVG